MTKPNYYEGKEKEEVLVAVKSIRKNLVLPKEVSEALKTLTLKERKAYVIRLVDKGWTLQSIANELNLTRESIRLYSLTPASKLIEETRKIGNLPLPEIPKTEIYRSRYKRTKIEPEVLERLKELHKLASKVRGRGKRYREEAEAFTKLAWEQIERGVSAYAIAKALGITHSALLFRFVRYGYLQSSGKSKAYKPIANRYQKEGK